MLKVLILVCSTALAPSECHADTAVAVINGPDAPSARLCGFDGQAYLAGTAIGELHDNEYVKLECSYTTIGTTVG